MKMYTIFDSAAEYFLPPFFARTDAEASRMFVQSLGDSFPSRADFKLVRIGEFDQDAGKLTPAPGGNSTVLSGLSIPEPKIAPETPSIKQRGQDTHASNGELIK